ncbi:D-hexose-6-phosphate mutarotase [Sulfurimonas sp.]|uniref:D-hexose-6-phosphate mutarotase n=1 Tax=Sulfurimonas sp. TaxID=2022749 RepID=UPI002AAF6A6E|nr:D-hexose-6-phosphate mutarotase [Sulfurimonas sp.]
MFKIIEVKNNSATAKIALQGAHLFHYQRTGETPLLWLSESSDFEKGKAIRGGVPICWPSFGNNNPDLPQHGFARTSIFEHLQTKEIDANTTQVTLKLCEYKLELEVKITIGNTLEILLTTTNKDTKTFKLTQALHTYFNISYISNIKIRGLDAKPYLDALKNKIFIQNSYITFEKEIDRVYQEVDSRIELVDIDRTISIENEGSLSVVVWNPWIDKCKRMSGMSDEAYKEFVCIESANAYDDFKLLKPNQKYRLKAIIC